MPKLYVVATPIGNLSDLSPRALETLQSVSLIAAEDTRVTGNLLRKFGVEKPMISCHRHNEADRLEGILSRMLEENIDVALTTDAGTPAISDPGEDLVALCAAHGVPVVAIPGPCALVTALSVSGLPTARFTFEGFLPQNKKNRRAQLESLRREERTMIFYEAPHKLSATLGDLQDAFGADRRISLCRELTKLHEEALRLTLSQAVTYYQENDPRGEYVLILAGAEKPQADETPTLEQCLERIAQLRAEGLSLKDACKQVSKESGIPRNTLYDAALS